MAQGRSRITTKKKVVVTGKNSKGNKNHRKTSRHNQKVLMRWGLLVVALLVVILIGVRCSKGDTAKAQEEVSVDETRSRVEFTRKGAMTVTYVESFDKDYYDASELQAQIDADVATYNDDHDGHVSAEDLAVADGMATLVMQYDAAADYEGFNDQDMFWGTLEEAENAGYDLSGLSGQTNHMDESETFGEGTARTLAANTVIVLTESLDVITATDILYASDNLAIARNDYAKVSGAVSSTDPAILILANK